MKPHILALALIPFLMGNKGGCTSEPPAPTVVTRTVEIAPPNECLSSDPLWKNPPAEGERSKETSRREQINKRNFNSMRSDRSVCRAGLKAATADRG